MVALLSGITPEQYLEQERKAEFNSEYVNGRVYAMGRCNAEHNTIAVNIGAELRLQFKGRSSRVYSRLLSVQEYVLVSQNQALVEKYTRQGEQWVLTEYAGLDAVLDLPVIGCRIPLTEIYDKVELDSGSPFEGGNNGNA
jgi:Uma2 family endonuclease